MSITKDQPDYQSDRRLSVRYPVHGSLVLDTAEKRYKALPVDLSLGGILSQAERVPPVDTLALLQLHVDGFGENIITNVRVIRSHDALAAAVFVFRPESLVKCIGWLASKDREVIVGTVPSVPEPPVPEPIRRRVFISFSKRDRSEVDAFINRWSVEEEVFTPVAVGLAYDQGIIESQDPEYVMNRIRRNYMDDSTVTILLIGTCTHSHRYVDWEISSSLRQRENLVPNGLLGILLPSLSASGNFPPLPPRFDSNWNPKQGNCYARYWFPPASGAVLRSLIEDAYSARTARAHLIVNPAEVMKNNSYCEVCGYAHPA